MHVLICYYDLANFSNYVKGQQMRDALGDLFGHGIFVANGEGWKYQRKTASVLFNVANFRDHFTEYVYEQCHIGYAFLTDHAMYIVSLSRSFM